MSPKRLNCLIESRRWCVLNSQLVHDGFCRRINKTEHVDENLSSRVGCRIGNWVTSYDCRRRRVLHYVHRPTQLNSTQHFSFQFFYKIRRQSSWASCEFNFNTHRTMPTRLNSTVESRRRRRCVLGLNDVVRSCFDIPDVITVNDFSSNPYNFVIYDRILMKLCNHRGQNQIDWSSGLGPTSTQNLVFLFSINTLIIAFTTAPHNSNNIIYQLNSHVLTVHEWQW